MPESNSSGGAPTTTTTTAIDHRFHNMFVDSWRAYQDYRNNNSTCYGYYDGDGQWTDSERTALSDRGQPAVVVNMIRPTIDRLLDMQIQRQADTVVRGREANDQSFASVLTAVVKQVNDANERQAKDSAVFREGAIGGMGWWEYGIDKDEEGKKQIFIEQEPWENMFPDPFFRHPDASDARWIIRQKWMDIDEAKKLWPSKADELDTVFGASSVENALLDYDGQEQEMRFKTAVFRYFDDTRSGRRIAVNEVYYTIPIPGESSRRKKMRHVIYSHNVILKGDLDNDDSKDNDPPYGIDAYPFIPFMAFRTRKGYPQGLVEFLKSPQEQLNKLNSKYIANVSTRQVVIEEGACEDVDTLKKEAAKPDGFMVVNNGALLQKQILLRDNFNENQQNAAMIQMSMDYIQRISGINDATLGIGGTNARSAQQEAGRQLAGAAMQSEMMQNFFQSKKQGDKVMLLLIGKHYTKKRAVRIVNPDGSEEFTYLNDTGVDVEGNEKLIHKAKDALRYDLTIEYVPEFDTHRQFQMQQIVEAAKASVIPPMIASEMILRYSDIPDKDEVITRMREEIKQQQQAAQAQQ